MPRKGRMTSLRMEFDRLEGSAAFGQYAHRSWHSPGHRSGARSNCAGAGLVWCPSSNLSLLWPDGAVERLAQRGRVALGTTRG